MMVEVSCVLVLVMPSGDGGDIRRGEVGFGVDGEGRVVLMYV